MNRLAPAAAVLLLFAAVPAAAAGQKPEELAAAGRLAEAEAAYRALQESAGLSPEQLDSAVEVSKRLNNWERVAQILLSHRKGSELSIPQRVELYEAQLRLGRRGEAEREILSLTRDSPRHEALHHLAAFFYLSEGRLERAVALYREFLRRNPRAVESRVNLSLVLFKLARTEPALDRLAEAFRIDPEAANLYFYRQLVRNMPPEGLARLAEDTKRARGIETDGARTHLFLAREYENLLQYENALRAYEAYVAEERPAADVSLSMARLYAQQGEGAKARRRLEDLLELPGRTGAEARLVSAELAVQEGAPEEAARLLEGIPGEYRSRPAFQYTAARVAISRGELEKAAGLLRRVIEQEPERAEAYFHLGQLLLRQGRREEGRRLLARFRELKERP